MLGSCRRKMYATRFVGCAIFLYCCADQSPLWKKLKNTHTAPTYMCEQTQVRTCALHKAQIFTPCFGTLIPRQASAGQCWQVRYTRTLWRVRTSVGACSTCTKVTDQFKCTTHLMVGREGCHPVSDKRISSRSRQQRSLKLYHPSSSSPAGDFYVHNGWIRNAGYSANQERRRGS